MASNTRYIVGQLPPASTRPAETTGGVRRVYVDDVEPSDQRAEPADASRLLAKHADRATECASDPGPLVCQAFDNPLVSAVVMAFARHWPLRLRPDDFYATILHAVTERVNADPEKHRAAFVSWDGKKVLVVQDDAMSPGCTSPAQWRGVVTRWKGGVLATAEPAAARFLRTAFESSTPDAKTATDMAVLDTVKAYYEYRLCSNICGFPRIDLVGPRSDWAALRESLGFLDALGLAWWRASLEDIFDGVLASYDREDGNRQFWQRMYKENSWYGSGGQSVMTGWITELFGTSDPSRVRPGVTATPFRWIIDGCVSYPMLMVGGFAGVRQDPDDGTVAPELGWCVLHDGGPAPWDPPAPGTEDVFQC